MEEVVEQQQQEPMSQPTETVATLTPTHHRSPLAGLKPLGRKRKVDSINGEESMSMFKRVRLLERRYALKRLGGLTPASDQVEASHTAYLELPATTNLGLPTDHVERRLETIDTRNPTNKSTTDSAYQSQLTKLGGRNTPKKKRKLNERDESVLKPCQCTLIDSDDKHCLHEFASFTDWKRHQETHLPQKVWECLIQGSNTTASCHICSGNIDLAGH
jgi:hypothetical protein